ncbi:MAG: class I SAM-dependent RNA methyltransferase [Clostridiales bacterium]|nr:class I SAM-dependent RNA methyltransferase [Clostridiales bacterium]
MDRNQVFSWIAVSAFGLEGAISGELKRLGLRNVRAENGFVRFQGSVTDAYRCNLSLRFSDRVYLILAEARCTSFEDLFQLVSEIPWENLSRGDESFHVTAQCARSRLMSPRDCQSITKKALLERLKRTTNRKIFPETGIELPVHLRIHSDLVQVLLDTSGASLSRRGYRTWNGEAPLRETLAAALVEFSPWRPGLPLYDPCCGTGTLLIEAALRQGHIAPGLRHAFAMEEFCFFPSAEAAALKKEAASACCPERIQEIGGSDLDPEAIDLSNRHLRQAGLENRISFDVLPLQEVQLKTERGVFLCNPPYGERLGDQESCRRLYRDLHRLQERHPTWSLCAISSDPGFEKAYGRRADKTRRLYNGRLECQFYTFLSSSV